MCVCMCVCDNVCAQHEWTPLHLAASEGHKDMLASLLTIQADIEARDIVSGCDTRCVLLYCKC